ncbi:hypothetical protein Dsin_012219 [Dipteronia sinensis]|uniref:RNase H type-1 domain-containing protein n=1 Tax=Dipteronia sinensis TaxID=43782 RepID=A0AAE0AIV8_9ROSI|nr:hypothetical protein Dsin_012219 [Dipteronia sinensis]
MSLTIMMMDLKTGCIDVIKKKRIVNIRWRPPLEGKLKFNVDGSSRGNPGRSGIGAAEIAAILKACQLCESVHCPSDVNVVIKSDYKSAASWVNGVGVGNIQFLDSLLEIMEILHRLKPKVSVHFANRSGNNAADFLVKHGAASGLQQKAWV